MEWTATQLATRPSYTAKWVGSTQLLLLLPGQLLPVFEVGAGVGGVRMVVGGCVFPCLVPFCVLLLLLLLCKGE